MVQESLEICAVTHPLKPRSQIVQVKTTCNGKATTTNAQRCQLKGKTARLAISGASQAQKVSVRTIGREDPTSAEAFCTEIILQILHNKTAFLTFPFVREIWFSKRAKARDSGIPSNSTITVAFDSRPLNESQKSAVKAILSDSPSERLVVIQGPPGTGKTTVIAAAVISAVASGSKQGLWLVAQSNVAVKNIAEKLADVEFLDFKLLVSKDFHFDWYLYLPRIAYSL
jgi:primosomal protein N'